MHLAKDMSHVTYTDEKGGSFVIFFKGLLISILKDTWSK